MSTSLSSVSRGYIVGPWQDDWHPSEESRLDQESGGGDERWEDLWKHPHLGQLHPACWGHRHGRWWLRYGRWGVTAKQIPVLIATTNIKKVAGIASFKDTNDGWISFLLYQVMWTMRWRKSFPSTCSPEQGQVLDPPLSPPPAVVPVPPLPTENLQPPAGLVVHHTPPDHHKVNTARHTPGIRLLKALSNNLLRLQSLPFGI